MALDYKKEQKELYQPKAATIVDVPEMIFIMVDGVGNPNTSARFERFTEGLCALIMHTGPYDDEPKAIEKLERFITESGYQNDISDMRRHHEIYLNDPRKVAPEKNKTIIRHPVKEV